MHSHCTVGVSLWAAASAVLIEFKRHSPDSFQVGASEPKGHLDWTDLNDCLSYPLRRNWLWAWLGSDWCVHLKSASRKSMKNEMSWNCMSSDKYTQWNQLWWRHLRGTGHVDVDRWVRPISCFITNYAVETILTGHWRLVQGLAAFGVADPEWGETAVSGNLPVPTVIATLTPPFFLKRVKERISVYRVVTLCQASA